jgi:hypothetical protein
MSGCYAFNREGLRCDGEGGHDGLHTLTIEWDDDDIWTPGAGPTPLRAEEVAALGPVPTFGEGTPGRCLLCNHRMHGGECERCDCKAGIPS